jgi:signal transduction histidine kinase
MGSFLPIRWPPKEVFIALCISGLTLAFGFAEISLGRVIETSDVAYLLTSFSAIWLIWSLIAKGRALIEARVLERTAALSELARYLQSSRESERLALSQELHDELGAIVTLAKLDVVRITSKLSPLAPNVADSLQNLDKTLACALALKSRLVEDLHPSSLSHLGLGVTLENYLKDFAKRADIEVDLRLELPSLNAQTSLTVFRIVQESLTNVVRHARAGKVTVSVKELGPDLEIAIQDDGVGFETTVPKNAAHGVEGMSHRVNSIGGRFQITSRAGSGTKVLAFVPISTLFPESRQSFPAESCSSSKNSVRSPIF